MRINCGGFELNENDFKLDGETLSLKNSGGGMIIVHGTIDGNTATITDMTAGELFRVAQIVPVLLVESVVGFGIIGSVPIGVGRNQSGGYMTSHSFASVTYLADSDDDYFTATQH